MDLQGQTIFNQLKKYQKVLILRILCHKNVTVVLMLLLVVCFIGHSEASVLLEKAEEREGVLCKNFDTCVHYHSSCSRDKERKSFATFVLCKICKQSTLSLEKTSASAFLQLNLSSAKYCTENKLDNF